MFIVFSLRPLIRRSLSPVSPWEVLWKPRDVGKDKVGVRHPSLSPSRLPGRLTETPRPNSTSLVTQRYGLTPCASSVKGLMKYISSRNAEELKINISR